jgi:hypothetical protein
VVARAGWQHSQPLSQLDLAGIAVHRLSKRVGDDCDFGLTASDDSDPFATERSGSLNFSWRSQRGQQVTASAGARYQYPQLTSSLQQRISYPESMSLGGSTKHRFVQTCLCVLPARPVVRAAQANARSAECSLASGGAQVLLLRRSALRMAMRMRQ